MSENIISENVMLENPKSNKSKVLILFALLVVASGAAYGVYWVKYVSKFVTTDNAYTAVEIAQITPSIGGTISEILVNDTQRVKAGDILVKIDQTDAKLALLATEADLQRANAQLEAANSEYQRASTELTRRKVAIGSGSVSGDELTRAQNGEAMARANQNVAKSNIAFAKAKVEQAQIDLDRTVIKAPIGGIVAKRQVQLGQRVQSGMPLLSIVPADKMHVDANFKEVQLEDVKVGQSAILHADIYGKSVTYHGVVDGFSGGSGSAFSAIPAQNATGNWIKVVQRLPVRIKLDENELKANPLKVGLSMSVEIDVSAKTN
jgi:membrane fusion protein (multidrug efflux system)